MLQLIRGVKGDDTEGKEMTDMYNWYILPLANPDGYAYTWNAVRFKYVFITVKEDTGIWLLF